MKSVTVVTNPVFKLPQSCSQKYRVHFLPELNSYSQLKNLRYVGSQAKKSFWPWLKWPWPLRDLKRLTFDLENNFQGPIHTHNKKTFDMRGHKIKSHFDLDRSDLDLCMTLTKINRLLPKVNTYLVAKNEPRIYKTPPCRALTNLLGRTHWLTHWLIHQH